MLAETQRLDMLGAMGVDVYRLRRATPTTLNAAKSTQASISAVAEARTGVQVIVVCAQGMRSAVSHARLFAALPHVLGVATSAIGWLEATANGDLAVPPPAAAYIVFGASLTRAFGVQLSTKQQSAATIAVCAEPQDLLDTVTAKRMLWQALKPVAHRLRQPAN